MHQLEVREFTRRSFPVQAVEVTEENLKEVAQWCGGKVKTFHGETYIHVPVKMPNNPYKSPNPFKAFIGYRVLKSETGFRVYRPDAFEAAFEPVH